MPLPLTLHKPLRSTECYCNIRSLVCMVLLDVVRFPSMRHCTQYQALQAVQDHLHLIRFIAFHCIQYESVSIL